MLVPTWFPQRAFPVATYDENKFNNHEYEYIKFIGYKAMDTYIPNYEGVVVLATKRCEVFLVVREGEALNEHLVELEALNDLKGVEVPNNDVSLNIVINVCFKVGDATLTAASNKSIYI